MKWLNYPLGLSVLILAGASNIALAVADRLDFQTYEESNPLSDAERRALTPDDLKAYSQLQLDYLYSQLQSGPLPDGSYTASVIFDTSRDNDIAKVVQAVLPDEDLSSLLKSYGADLWQVKAFNRGDQTVINDLIFAKRFPAKVYCGQSLIDSRKESVILDYRFSSDLPGYNQILDWIVSGQAAAMREEIRMIRPGFYLGRAYLYSIFALNFTLYRAPELLNEADSTQACYLGGFAP